MKSIKNCTIKIIALLLVIFQLCGCAGSGTILTTELPSQTPDATPQAVSGGTLRLAMPQNISQLENGYDPIYVSTVEMYQLYSLVYDSLIAIDGNNKLTPALVQSWSQYSNEGEWRLNLRSDVYWHDGTVFTADDVIYTFEQLRSLTDGYYRDVSKNIESMYKQDDLTVIVKCTSPGITALYSLNFPVKKAGSSKDLLGTGAYKVHSISDERIVLKANNDWWEKSAIIDTIEFHARSSNELEITSYEAGLLNFVATSSLTVEQYASVGETIVQDYMTQQMETLLINHDNSLLADRNFRTAIAKLIDRSTIISNVYMGKAQSCDVPFPPDSWLYDSSQTAIDYSRNEAMELLLEAGCSISDDGLLMKNGKQVTLRLLTGETTENMIRADVAKLIKQNLEAVGMRIELIELEHDLTKEENPFIEALNNGEWDLATVGFNISQSNDLSEFINSNGKNNFGNYSNEKLENMVSLIKKSSSESLLRERAQTLQSEFVNELPFIVLYFKLNSVIYNANLKGIETVREPNLLKGIHRWYYVK